MNRRIVQIVITICSALALPGKVSAGPWQNSQVRIDAQTLTSVQSAVTAVDAAVKAIDVNDLGVKYKDGKSIEAYRNILLTQTKLVAESIARLRQRDSIVLVVIVAQTVDAMGVNIRDLCSVLEIAGRNANTALPVKAAISLVKVQNGLAQPSSAINERVQEIAESVEAALSSCK